MPIHIGIFFQGVDPLELCLDVEEDHIDKVVVHELCVGHEVLHFEFE